MASGVSNDTVSASTGPAAAPWAPSEVLFGETMSDLETQTASEVCVDSRARYTETFDVGAASGSDAQQEYDSEATVSDADVWESGSDNPDVALPWQSTQRLTSRQRARQERLLQGIAQTQWDDMRLPRGLDLSHKAKQTQAVSEEQHLKRVKAAELRRIRTQKARRDEMEITKARIRAATSNKFRDMVENGQTEKRRGMRQEPKLLPGRIRMRYRPGKAIMILPEGGELPSVFQSHHKSVTYPPKKIRRTFHLHRRPPDSGFLRLGLRLDVREAAGRLELCCGEKSLGEALLVEGPAAGQLSGKVTSLRYSDRPDKASVRICLTTEASLC